jgi:hypothetical protein
MALVLMTVIALVTLGSTIVTLAWAVPAASELYLGRRVPR